MLPIFNSLLWVASKPKCSRWFVALVVALVHRNASENIRIIRYEQPKLDSNVFHFQWK